MYHNTTNTTGSELRSLRIKAQTQEDVVYRLFKSWGPMTASETLFNAKMMLDGPVLLTSIRRTITDLSKPIHHADGRLIRSAKLERTEEKRPGLYGAKEFVYTLKDSE